MTNPNAADEALPSGSRFPATEAVEDAWRRLRALTAARIGLERSGASLATKPMPEFRLAHASARDAVHDELDDVRLSAEAGRYLAPVLIIGSAATDRRTYLLRPDLGRNLGPHADRILAPLTGAYDIAFVVADGLSARAVQSHAVPVLAAALPVLSAEGWRVAPLVVVQCGRVAIGDAVPRALGAGAVAVLIGERPGLSSPNSMSAYLTWRPGPTTTNAERNCITNIRPEAMGYAEAASKLVFLLGRMRARGLSGVRLKDESDHRAPIASLGADPARMAC